MAKITKAEMENRVTQVTDLLLKGGKRGHILQYAEEKTDWNVSISMIDKYIAAATKEILESLKGERDWEIALARGRYEYLYTQSITRKDLRGALSVVQAKSKLLGLDAPTRTDITSGGKEVNPYMSMPKEELLALMRKKLAEDE